MGWGSEPTPPVLTPYHHPFLASYRFFLTSYTSRFLSLPFVSSTS